MFAAEPIDSPRLVGIRLSFAALIASVHTLVLTVCGVQLHSVPETVLFYEVKIEKKLFPRIEMLTSYSHIASHSFIKSSVSSQPDVSSIGMRFPVFVNAFVFKRLTESDVGWNRCLDMFEKEIQTILIAGSTTYK